MGVFGLQVRKGSAAGVAELVLPHTLRTATVRALSMAV